MDRNTTPTPVDGFSLSHNYRRVTLLVTQRELLNEQDEYHLKEESHLKENHVLSFERERIC